MPSSSASRAASDRYTASASSRRRRGPAPSSAGRPAAPAPGAPRPGSTKQTIDRPPKPPTGRLTIFRLVLLLGVQQREGVLDALLEDVIRELPVGQDAGELQGADHQGEDAERSQ